jgi:hypothetical protein
MSKRTPAKLYCWRISRIRSKAEHLGCIWPGEPIEAWVVWASLIEALAKSPDPKLTAI